MRSRLFLFLLIFLGLCGPVAAAAPPLIVISIDGFRADYLDRGQTPALARLARNGAHAKAMHPSFPSLTYPNHYTLVTGLTPDHHGIVDNNMFDAAIRPDSMNINSERGEDPRWWEGATPLWATAQAQGVLTASAGWPGSEGFIHNARPDYEDPWRPNRNEREIAVMALNWMDLPAAYRPVIVFLYFDAVDKAGHADGPGSDGVNKATHDVDAAIATLQTGLKRRGIVANIVVVSDHGMAATDDSRVTAIDDLVPINDVMVVSQGPGAGINPLPGHEDEVTKALVGHHDHATCWRKGDMPAQFKYGANPRVPAIYCLSDAGWRLATRSEIVKWDKNHPGGHGYDPADPTMNALFVAAGPAFRSGVTLEPFDNVDVYPLLAKLAGVKPEKNDGSLEPLMPALRQAAALN